MRGTPKILQRRRRSLSCRSIQVFVPPGASAGLSEYFFDKRTHILLPERQVTNFAYTRCFYLEEGKSAIWGTGYDVNAVPALVLNGKDIRVLIILQEFLCDVLSQIANLFGGEL